MRKTPKRYSAAAQQVARVLKVALDRSPSTQGLLDQARELLERAESLPDADQEAINHAVVTRLSLAAELLLNDAEAATVADQKTAFQFLVNVAGEAIGLPPQPLDARRLSPSERIQVHRLGDALLIQGFYQASAEERTRFYEQLETSTKLVLDEPGPGRRPGGGKTNKVRDGDDYRAMIRERVYKKARDAGIRDLRSRDKSVIARWLGLSPNTITRYNTAFGVTWDDILDRRV